jgi:hypothetical protein
MDWLMALLADLGKIACVLDCYLVRIMYIMLNIDNDEKSPSQGDLALFLYPLEV